MVERSKRHHGHTFFGKEIEKLISGPNYISRETYRQLLKEKEKLEAIVRERFIEYGQAASGDWHEGFDPSAEMLSQEATNLRIIRSKLKDPVFLDDLDISTDEVGVGSRVTILEESAENTYTIVGYADIDPTKNFISYQSPFAKELLGKPVGEEFVSRIGKKGIKRTLKILKIERAFGESSK